MKTVWTKEWHQNRLVELAQSHKDYQDSGIVHLPCHHRMVLGKGGLAVSQAKQSRRQAIIALEYAKQGDAHAAGYFAKLAVHLFNNSQRLIEVGFTAKNYVAWFKEKDALRLQ